MANRDEEAHAVHRALKFRRGVEERRKNKEEARLTNERIVEDRHLVKRVRKDLADQKSKKLIGRKYGIPLYTVMYIWCEWIQENQNGEM